MTDLTDLEQAALGVVWRDGPCTPYQVRKQFLDSPTPSWSGSAGTIYPLMRRLEDMGLVPCQVDAVEDAAEVPVGCVEKLESHVFGFLVGHSSSNSTLKRRSALGDRYRLV